MSKMNQKIPINGFRKAEPTYSSFPQTIKRPLMFHMTVKNLTREFERRKILFSIDLCDA